MGEAFIQEFAWNRVGAQTAIDPKKIDENPEEFESYQMKTLSPSYATTILTDLYPKGTDETQTWFPCNMKEEELYKPGTKPGFNPVFIAKVSRTTSDFVLDLKV